MAVSLPFIGKADEGTTNGPILTLHRDTIEQIDTVTITNAQLFTSYTFQSSSDLKTWQPVWTDTALSNGCFSISVLGSDQDKAFYRVRDNGPASAVTIVTLDPASPLSGIVLISATNQNVGIPIGVYDIHCHRAMTLKSITFQIQINGAPTNNISQIFNKIWLKIGTSTNVMTSSQVLTNDNGTILWAVTFGGMSVPILSGYTIPATLFVDAAADTDGSLNGIKVWSGFTTDRFGSAINIVDIANRKWPVQATDTGGGFITFADTVFVNTTSTSLGSVITVPGSGHSTQVITFTFTLTALDEPIYLSTGGTPSQGVSSVGTTVTLINFADDDTSNDTSDYLSVAPGQTKTFTEIYTVSGAPGAVSGSLWIPNIYYGTSPTNLAEHSIVDGLDDLHAFFAF